MESPLNPHEVRVLGCLIEKEVTTPEYYPLSLNALLNACNQKSSREPVMELEEEEVLKALDGLRGRRLVYRVDVAGSRVPKFRYDCEVLGPLERAERALLGVLLLRGLQTPGELRARAERLHFFPDTEAVLETLKSLAEGYDEPWAMQLPRQPGRKEARWSHLLAGEPQVDAESGPEEGASGFGTPPRSRDTQEERLSAQELRIQELESRLDDLTREFEKFRDQFV